jgi:hypothetical protein
VWLHGGCVRLSGLGLSVTQCHGSSHKGFAVLACSWSVQTPQPCTLMLTLTILCKLTASLFSRIFIFPNHLLCSHVTLVLLRIAVIVIPETPGRALPIPAIVHMTGDFGSTFHTPWLPMTPYFYPSSQWPLIFWSLLSLTRKLVKFIRDSSCSIELFRG